MASLSVRAFENTATLARCLCVSIERANHCAQISLTPPLIQFSCSCSTIYFTSFPLWGSDGVVIYSCLTSCCFFWLQLPKNPQSAVSPWEFEWLYMDVRVYCVWRAWKKSCRWRTKSPTQTLTRTPHKYSWYALLILILGVIVTRFKVFSVITTFKDKKQDLLTHFNGIPHSSQMIQSRKLREKWLLTAQCTKFVLGDWSIT